MRIDELDLGNQAEFNKELADAKERARIKSTCPQSPSRCMKRLYRITKK